MTNVAYILEAVCNHPKWSKAGFKGGLTYDSVDPLACPNGRKHLGHMDRPFSGPSLNFLYFGSTLDFKRRLKQHRLGHNSSVIKKLEKMTGVRQFCLFPVALATGFPTISEARRFEMFVQRGSDPEFVKLYSRTKATNQEKRMVGFKNSFFNGHTNPSQPYMAKKAALLRLRVAITTFSKPTNYNIKFVEMASTY
jgi:predicted GIY-YIG superfamily endonuclease